jgi:hypothetical protein
MNTSSENFTFDLADLQSQIVEVITSTEVPLTPAIIDDAELHWKNSMLRGYESTMRRHAAACEAGR